MDAFPLTEMRAVVRGYARILAGLGSALGERPLVLPNSEFFPDVFQADLASVQRLLERVQEHAGLSDMAIEARIADIDGMQSSAGGCGSCAPTGSCATPAGDEPKLMRLVDAGEFWQLNVHPGELMHPVALTTALARGLTLAHVSESTLGQGDLELDVTVDLAATALGFGVLLLEGSHIYKKSCGGPSVSSVTALAPSELGAVLALFVALGGHSARRARAHLSATQAEAFDEAKACVDSNRALVALLARDPARVARGDFELGEAKSWLLRAFGSRGGTRPALDAEETLGELERELSRAAPGRRAPTKAKDPEFEAIRRLVDEALNER
jgi:hypothetical protein